MNEAELTVSEKILLVRIEMAKEYPFFSYIFNFMPVVEADWLPYKTLATDMTNIFYDAGFVKKMTLRKLMFGFMHETCHVILAHCTRGKGLDRNKWGAAIDYVTNDILMQQPRTHMDPIENILYDRQYHNMMAEDVYMRLPDKKYETFDFHPDERASGFESKMEPVNEESRALWTARVYGAFQYARAQGQMPAGLSRLFDTLTKPHVPWRTVLHNQFQQYCHDDFNWSRPNRNFIHMDLILPSVFSENMGDVAVIVDTSSSITDAVGSQFLTEIQCIRNTHPMTMHLIACDAKVHEHHVIEQHGYINFKTLKISGRGGTDFRPAFEYIKNKIKKRITLAVYLTDGYGDYPNVRPNYPVLWCMTKQHVQAPWGRSVYVNV